MSLLRILFAFIIYIFILSIIFICKPSCLFNIDESIKDFGFSDENKSIISLYIMIPILILIIYIILIKYGNNRIY